MSKAEEEESLWTGQEDDHYDGSVEFGKAPEPSRDAVTFIPSCDGQVEFSQLHPVAGQPSPSSRICDKPTRWIVILVTVVAVLMLILIPVVVYMVHLHPKMSGHHAHDLCSRVPCQNNATCSDTEDEFTCQCPPGFTGVLCEVDIDDCASSPCSDGVATCRDVINGYYCECEAGFTGDLCETDIDDCARSPCVDGVATCVDGANNFTCHCIPGYTGRFCEVDIDECTGGTNCVNGATCHDGINSYYCQCDGGFTGANCEHDDDECRSSPCHHMATCHDKVNGYRCQCAHGYKGAHCDIEVDECKSNPCVNGATCHNRVNSYYCQCDGGYTGKYCETDDDACKSLPCFNDGTCVSDVDGFLCECPTGYSGKQCETDINECESSPCEHGGECVDATGLYLCVCGPAFHGTHCEMAVGTCPAGFVTFHDLARCYHIEADDELEYEIAQGVCAQKNATLASLETAAELQAVGIHFTVEGRYHILSARRSSADDLLYWNTGQLLTNTNSKWSSDQPKSNYDCVGAIMRDDITKYYSMECSLSRPYVCERIMDMPPGVSDCRIMPCMNGATCHNVTGGGFSCQCSPAFTGQYCTQNKDECISQPCLNGATCRDGHDKYTCVCPSGFTGEICETNIDDCASQPCHNHGTCIDGLNSYTCACPTNHTGARCEAGPDDPCLPEFEFYNVQGRCYLVREGSTNERNYEEATAICSTYRALLVSFETAEELKFVGALFTVEGRYHITSGLKIEDNSFRWGTGVALPRNDHKWHSGQPSYDTLVAAIRDDDDTTLYTMSDNIARPYVCEMSMLLPPGVNDCRSMPCLNGASCQNFANNTYKCICGTGFVGQRCETDVDECAIDHCLNGATCVNTPGSYSCQCAPGYTGPRCATDIDECLQARCVGGSTCVDGINSYKCLCPTNSTGRHCETDINAPCSAGWVFFRQGGRCYLIKEGSANELRWQDAEQACQENGATLASLETPEEVDFVGGYFNVTGRYHILSARKENGNFYWNTGAPLLESHPKWHSGQPDSDDCTALIKSGTDATLYSMGCAYDRPFVCEMHMFLPPGANNCQSTPCRNGGECHDLVNSTYYCNCTTGFTGEQCETDIDECLANPCENGGICYDAYGAYNCECATGYEGLHCENDIDDCASNPCGNASTCIDDLNSYSCLCAANWTGPNCETGPDDPCPHDFVFYEQEARCYFLEEDSDKQLAYRDAAGVCQSKNSSLADLETEDEMTFVGQLFSWTGRYHVIGAQRGSDANFYWTNGNLLSRDFPKWSGSEPSSSKDCTAVIFSDHTAKLYSLSCTDARPYICERSMRLPPGVHSCRSRPCFHGATCVEGDNTYDCHCPPGFMGTYCETDFDECASHPCQHGATCTDGRGVYTCECVTGYTGQNCETNIDDCRSDPCANNGTCVDGVDSYTCVCAANYTGATCLAGLYDTCPEGFLHYEEKARCYLYQEESSQERSWTDAQAVCQSHEADLASLETAEEVEFVGLNFSWTGRYHIVSAKKEEDGVYRWLSREVLPLSHPSWQGGEPGTYKECVAAIMETGITTLYGLDCSYRRPFVCERGIL